MGKYAELLVMPARRMRGYSEVLLKDISAANFARLPRADGKTIATNHPAFVYGHLALYPAKMLQGLGMDVGAAAVPESWEPIFKAGAECRDDPEGTIYPPMSEITSKYFSATDHLHTAIEQLDDAVLLTPVADEKARQFMPITGGRINFVLNNHVMMHMGQVSAWRRMMGLPSAM